MEARHDIENFVKWMVRSVIIASIFATFASIILTICLSYPGNLVYQFLLDAVSSVCKVSFYRNLSLCGTVAFLFSGGLFFLFRMSIARKLYKLFLRLDVETDFIRLVPRKYFALWLSLFVLLGIVSIFLSITNKEYYIGVYIAEDGFIEYASFVFWMVSFLFFLLSYRRRQKSVSTTIIYLCFIMLSFFCGMEEISWGQRIFGFKGPTFITQHNLQGEFNLHDIGSISLQENAFFLLIVIIFLIIPVLKQKKHLFSNFLENIGWPVSTTDLIPLFLIMLVVWISIGLIMGTLGFWSISWKGYYNQCDDEIFELYAAMLFCAKGCFDFFSIKALKRKV
ncbi:hypothetical protein [Desulfovulcanus sp.]